MKIWHLLAILTDSYGQEHKIKLSGKTFKVIPLCHPRQAQRLGASSVVWYELHKYWRNNKMKEEI
jgi:hypothetical protein